MDVFTWLWVIWIAMFGAIEGTAIISNVLPDLMLSNGPYQPFTHSVFAGQSAVACFMVVITSSYFQNLLRVQFSVGMVFSATYGLRMGTQSVFISSCCAALNIPIPCIDSARAKKQMVRIYTRRVVAFMTDTQSFWNWAESQLVREPMRGDGLTIMPEATMPEVLTTPSPRPAFVGSSLICVAPKATENAAALIHPSAALGAVLSGPMFFGCRPITNEWILTTQAGMRVAIGACHNPIIAKELEH